MDKGWVCCACAVEEVGNDSVLWQLECRVESLHLWSTRDQGSNIAWSEKKANRPFPSVNNLFTLRRPAFTFKYHPNLCKQKAQITVCFNFRHEFALSFMDDNQYLLAIASHRMKKGKQEKFCKETIIHTYIIWWSLWLRPSAVEAFSR